MFDWQREPKSSRCVFECLDFWFRVSEDLRLSGHQAHRKRRVVLPGLDDASGEGDRGQRCRTTLSKFHCCSDLSTRGRHQPTHSLFSSLSVFSLFVFFLHTISLQILYISSPPSTCYPSFSRPVSGSPQASLSWMRAAKSSSPRASPSPSPSLSQTVATRTTLRIWRLSTSGSLRKRPTSSSTWRTADRWAETEQKGRRCCKILNRNQHGVAADALFFVFRAHTSRWCSLRHRCWGGTIPRWPESNTLASELCWAKTSET